MRTIIAVAFVFLFSFGTSFAAPLNPSQAQMWTGPAVVPASSLQGGDGEEDRRPTPMPAGSNMRASDMPGMREGFMTYGSSTSGMPSQMRGVPGVVSSTGSNSFAMTLPGNREHATTTLTVNVTSATVYMHASSTASFSDIVAGTRVVVVGKISTSTKSISAERVIIVDDIMKKREEPRKGFGGFLERFKNFFTGKRPSMDGSSEREGDGQDGPAAVVQSGFVNSLLNTIFGWL